jgi:hypothetical protein
MIDILLHVVLGAAFMGLYLGLGLDPFMGSVLATFQLYFRELIQHQRNLDLPFWRGWALTPHHNAEWAWPAFPLLALGGALKFF